MEFTIKIADVNVKINSIYDEVYALCGDYLSDGRADFCVDIAESDIAFEREKSKREAAYERRPYRDFPDSYLETLAVLRKIAVKILDHGAFLMHGALVGLDGRAYLFTAPSGVGKSTHARFWLEAFPDAFIINGDKPFIKIKDGKAYACGSPWAGKEGFNRNVSLPLFAVCALTRGDKNSVEPLTFERICPLLIGQSYRPTEEEGMIKTLEYIKEMGRSARFFLLRCNLDKNAANIAYDGMNG